ncbi:Ig-like domain-containing protein [Malaciobacter sp. WC5094]
MIKIAKTVSIISATLILSGCGGGGGSSETSATNSRSTAYLIDAPIVGATYKNENGEEGVTKEGGAFSYTGGKVSFYVGDIKIGELDSINNDNKVMLQDLLKLENRDDTTNDKLVNYARFLQSLDTDEKTDAIELGSNVNKFKGDEFKKDLEDIDIVSVLKEENIDIKDVEEVKKHLKNSVSAFISNDDNEKPIINRTFPENNANEVLINENLVVEFNENISKESVLKSEIVLKNQDNLPVEIEKKVINNKLIIKPKNNLDKDALYTLSIDDKISDYSGNLLSDKRSVSFRTVSQDDNIAPIILSTLPSVKENINLNETFVVNFSEKMKDSTINSNNITLVKKGTQDKIPLKIKHEDKKALISASILLDSNTTYTLSLSNLEDESSNAISSSKNIDFTTANSFVFNGFEYNVIKSPITNRYWLDRNLGAQKVCEDKSDEKCYGDYFQWGRKANGHEKKSSEVFDASLNPLSKDVLSNGKFATWADDWRKVRNDDLWKGANAINAVCPAGFRVPTIDELLIETKNVNALWNEGEKLDGQYTNIDNFLKFPNNGFRKNLTRDGILELREYSGNIWSSSVNEVGLAYSLGFFPGGSADSAVVKAQGKAVRCIKDYSDESKPEVTYTTPKDNQSDVPINSNLEITFSKPVIKSIVRSNFKLLKGEEEIAINILRNVNNHTIIISMDKNQGDNSNGLSYDSEYKLIIKKDIYDVSGNTLEEDKVITFRTQKDPQFAASKVYFYPKNNQTDFIRNENIQISFTKDINENLINNNVGLFKGDVEVQASKTYKDKTLLINPNSSLEANTTYTIKVKAALEDTNAISLEQDIQSEFTTGNIEAVEDKFGFIYKELVSPKTGKTWLDRNIKATTTCETITSKACYGDYFKWEERDVCPVGYKVPSQDELYDEIEGFTKSNIFENFLRLPASGKKIDTHIDNKDNFIYLWTNSNKNSEFNKARALEIKISQPEYLDNDITNALPIRCIKK